MKLTHRLLAACSCALLLATLGAAAPARAAVTLPSFLPADVKFTQAASGFTEPVFVTNAGDGSGRLFAVQHTGVINVIKHGVVLPTPFLDIHSSVVYDGGERGMLGLAFHPSYASNGKFYVTYTAPRPGDSAGSILTLERFSVSSTNADVADPSSGTILLTIDHPTYGNHNGGTLTFGPDGYLYWSTGDGGSGGDPSGNAQNLTVLLGKLLRLDVDSASPYAIPSTNPFFSDPTPGVRKEIWAYGLRNPWRLSFDSLTGDLYIGDVGQNLMEEVDFQPAGDPGGENYGWNVMEGTLCFNSSNFNLPLSSCNESGKVLPVAEYDHSLSRCALTGGYVYRGAQAPLLHGYFFYGDYCSGAVYALHNDPSNGWVVTTVAATPHNISSFGQAEGGALYLLDLNGSVYQIKYEPPFSDFESDGKSDPAKFYSSTDTVWWLKSTTGTWDGAYLGSDVTSYVPRSDFDGDGKADPAKWVSSSDMLWYLQSSTSTWGGAYMGTDVSALVPGSDFDGDGKTDPAKYIASGYLWYLGSKTGTWQGVYIGTDGTPLWGCDFDGDGVTDPAKYVASTGTIWYLGSKTGTWNGVTIGNDGVPVSGSDFDGDGKTDPAKFLASTNTLWYLSTVSGTWQGVYVGPGAVQFVAGNDFDGDGKTDPATFNPATGALWYLQSKTSTWQGVVLGTDTFDIAD